MTKINTNNDLILVHSDSTNTHLKMTAKNFLKSINHSLSIDAFLTASDPLPANASTSKLWKQSATDDDIYTEYQAIPDANGGFNWVSSKNKYNVATNIYTSNNDENLVIGAINVGTGTAFLNNNAGILEFNNLLTRLGIKHELIDNNIYFELDTTTISDADYINLFNGIVDNIDIVGVNSLASLFVNLSAANRLVFSQLINFNQLTDLQKLELSQIANRPSCFSSKNFSSLPNQFEGQILVDDVSITGSPFPYFWACDADGLGNGKYMPLQKLPSKKMQFAFTGSDQNFIIPNGYSKLVVQVWGAGGSFDSLITGGAGGYTEAILPINGSDLSVGDTLTAVTGQGGQAFSDNSVNLYGFGGDSNGEGGGGGLSGIFLGASTILKTDTARALVIAGGGGGAVSNTNGEAKGGSGNDTSNAGGMADMQGISQATNSSGKGGGGGGYFGGSNHNRQATGTSEGGNGGSGYVVPFATSNSVQFTPKFSGTPPNTNDQNYVSPAGQSNTRPGEHGLIIVTFE